ncbi:MAG: 5-oxoprolinase subunit PxpB [bacterium]|nr:5-oxoprolinase subunit PxpB [bacterium]
MKFSFKPLGDNSLIIQFEDKICPEINSHIRKSALLLEKQNILGIIEWLPTYTSLTVYYKPEIYDYTTLVKLLKEMINNSNQYNLPPPEKIIIPVLYGGEYGQDLNHVASTNNLTIEDVIKIHTASEYLVYMLGFSPGFPYLGGMDESIATPRLKTPRALVNAGSVGIAGKQTGVYSLDSPGGWQIIGRTPLQLFNINNKKPFLLQAGNLIQFKPIEENEYRKIIKETGNE